MERAGEIESPRFLWVAGLTVAVSVLAVLGVRVVAVHLVHPKATFAPLAIGPPILDTVVCVVVALFVFMRVAPDPGGVKKWRMVATVVLALSFAPDVLLARSGEMGGGWAEAWALMAMHVAAWAVCVTLLPWLAYSVPAVAEEQRGLSIL